MVLIKNELLMKTLIRFGLTRIAFMLAGLSIGFAANADVKVNEVMPCNISTYKKNQNYNGWVELFNDANHSVDLKGYKIVHYKALKDGSLEWEWVWSISDSKEIGCGNYKVIPFDGSETDSKTERKLDSDGGAIVLKDKNGVVVDSFRYQQSYTHISYGIYNGQKGYMEPTAGSKNTQSYPNYSSSRCSSLSFEGIMPGVVSFNNSVIKIKNNTEGDTIYYTTNGSEPTRKSKRYHSDGIIVSNIISNMKDNVIIRARAYKAGMLPSEILTGTFISYDGLRERYRCKESNLPIVSIVTDSLNLYDPEYGIYTEGASDNQYSKNPHTSCLPDKKLNYVMDWARPANFEYFVGDEQILSHEVDIAVMGGCSRQYDTKSLKIKAGDRMGYKNGKLKYKFFEDKECEEYKSLQLRNGGNGHEEPYIRCRDGFMQNIAKNMGIDYQAYQPVAFYLNGKYRGLMGLRERTNKAFVETNFGLDSKDIDVIEITNKNGVVATCGDLEAYNNLVNFLSTSDPNASDYYERASQMMDMDEYMNYQIFEQFIVNTDWPANNCKIWRERNNGRFRWISFDTDFGLGLYGGDAPNYCRADMDMFRWCKGEGSCHNWGNGDTDEGFPDSTKWKTVIFSSLMKNNTFREKFLTKYLIHLGTSLDTAKISGIWNKIYNMVSGEYCATFGSSLNDGGMVSFAKKRPDYIYAQMMQTKNFPELEGSSLVNLKLSSNKSAGRILMNGELIPASTMSGKYFTKKTLKLEAVAPFGYRFLGWKNNGQTPAAPVVEEDPIDTVGLEYTHARMWKYFTSKDGKDSSSEWRKVDYNDSSWLPGSGVMGYNDNDNSSFNTVIESGKAGSHYAAVYFRSLLNLESVDNIQAIVARITYDDSFVLYVNGKVVKASNIDAWVGGNTFANTWANDSTEIVAIPSSFLNKGENILAVEVHQHEAGSSDLKLFFEESVVYGSPSAGNVSSGEYISTNPICYLNVSDDLSLTAVFEQLNDCEQPSIRINEICATSGENAGAVDEFGNHSDWFEIYNDGADTVNLAGLYLTDQIRNMEKYMIPFGYEETKVAPKDRVLIWADNYAYRGPLHAGFKLKNEKNSYVAINMKCGGETFSVDEVEYDYVSENMSYGLLKDGGDEWVTFGECSGGQVFYPTPGLANSSRFCGSDDCSEIYTDVEEVEQDQPVALSVYPNPVADYLNVKVNNTESVTLFLYDNLGRLLNVYENMGSSLSVDFRKYSSGVYYLEIFTDTEMYRESVIKE